MQNFQRKMRKTNEILNSKQCLLNAKWGKKLNQNKIIKKEIPKKSINENLPAIIYTQPKSNNFTKENYY